MANKRSSKKDIRRSAKRRVRNQEVRTGLKTHVKKVRQAAATNDGAKAAENLISAVSALDKAAQRGIIHKKQAARRKSRIAKVANAVAGKEPGPAVVVEKRASKVAMPKKAKPAAEEAPKAEKAAKPVAAKKAPAAKAEKPAAAKKPAAKKAEK